MTPADKLLTQIKEDREIRAKATQGEFEFEDSRGNQFIICVVKRRKRREDDAIKQIAALPGFASRSNDFQFLAHAANHWERKNRQLEIAVAALNDIANRISVSGADKNGGPDRVEISNDRNRRILDAKKALEDMEAVK